jgi:hypothetical protein
MTRITCERRGPNAELVINFLFFLLLLLLHISMIIIKNILFSASSFSFSTTQIAVERETQKEFNDSSQHSCDGRQR